jgi:dGTPase
MQLRPRQQIEAGRIHHHFRSALLNHQIIRLHRGVELEAILKPAASPRQHRDAQRCRLGANNLGNPLRRLVAHCKGRRCKGLIHADNIGCITFGLKPPRRASFPWRIVVERAMAVTPLAPYAVGPGGTRGRLHPEPESANRTPWQRDRDRIIHSTAFRRLQYKTQVFVNHEGDFFRTRLTHSIEVAQIARSISRTLGLDEDLTEALALAHDFGHTPFGHAGEDALDAAMKPYGGFDHNAQALRVVTRLESRYAAFDGLNLTWETLEGLAKHNGPVTKPPPYVAEYDARHKLDLSSQPSAEAQLAAHADDIAYHSHDLDDGLRAELFTIAEIAHLPIVGDALAAARQSSLDVPPSRLRHETIRRVVDALVTDTVAESTARLARLAPAEVDDIRRAKRPVIGFSPPIDEANRVIKEFLSARMYHHWRVNRMTSKARRVTTDLFSRLHAEPELLPDGWRARAGVAPGSVRAALLVADYIAGMTDRYAVDEHRRLTDLSVSG